MTVRAYPYDTTDAAGSVTELEWRRLMQWITPSGVLRGQGNEFAVTQRAAGANMSVDVATGEAFIVGHYLRSDAVETVAIADNATGNPRIDTIVARVDFVANTAVIACLAGVVAAAPAPTDLTQDLTSTWEEALAYVYVAAGENVSITDPEIGDCRHYATPQANDLVALARLATTTALAASTITGLVRVANANGALANIDGVAAVVGDVILDKDHATGSARGLWRIVDVGSATKPWRMRRSYSADASAKVRAGLWTRVAEGTANGDTGWLLTTNDPIVLGTTALTFTRFPTVATAVGVLLDFEWAQKTADEAVTSSVALQDDDHLTIAVGAGETWIFDFVLEADDQGGAGEFRFGLKVPTACVWNGNYIARLTGESSLTRNGHGDFGGMLADITGNSLIEVVARGTVMFRAIILNSVNAGNVTLQWAQGSSSGTATKLLKRSNVTARRVA